MHPQPYAPQPRSPRSAVPRPSKGRRSSRRRAGLAIFALAFGLAAGLVFGGVFGWWLGVADAQPATPEDSTAYPARTLDSEPAAPMTPVESQAMDRLTDGEQRDITIFRNVSPSVVNISTRSFRRDFWSLNVYEIPSGTGSGFVWDDQGHIVTNYHVIENASRFVRDPRPAGLRGRRSSAWRRERTWPCWRVDAPRELLRPVRLGTAQNLLVGQKVLAIGNPFGLDQTLTDRRGQRARPRAALARRLPHPRRHPDRRRDQSRQLRRARCSTRADA